MKIKDIIITKRAVDHYLANVPVSETWKITSALKVKKIIRALQGPIDDYNSTVSDLAKKTGYGKYEEARAAIIKEHGIPDGNGGYKIDENDKAVFEHVKELILGLSNLHKSAIDGFEGPISELIESDYKIDMPESKITISELESVPGIDANALNHLHFVLEDANA